MVAYDGMETYLEQIQEVVEETVEMIQKWREK
jgi:hypothetical protein